MPSTVTLDTRALDRSLATGLAWHSLARAVTQAVSWGTTIVAARLLTPADYGVMGMAQVFLGLTAMLTEFGLGTTVLAMRSLEPGQVRQLHGFSLALGTGAMLLTAAAAYPLSAFFRTPALVAVLLALSVTFLLDAGRTIPGAVMTRELRFRPLAILDGGKVLFVSAVTLGLAWLGWGYWALVLSAIAAAVISTLMVTSLQPMMPARPRLRDVAGALRFSAEIIVARIAWYFYVNADFLVAGRLFGAASMGAYSYAWTLASAPTEKVTTVFARVTPAVFASVISTPDAARRYFLRISEVLALVVLPATIGVALVAPDFVLAVLGAKWSDAIIPLQLLCLYAALQTLVTVYPHVVAAAGQARFMMWLNIVTVAVLPAAFFASGTAWGIVGIATVWLSVYPLFVAPLAMRTLAILRCTWRAYVGALWPAVSASAGMVVAVLGVRALLPAVAGPWERLLVGILAGILGYGASLVLGHRRRLRAIWAAAQALRQGKADAEGSSA